MSSVIKPLVKLTANNKVDYERLLFENAKIYAIHENHTFEDILSHMIRQEMKYPREERRQELITILEMMDLSDIQE